MANKKTTRMVVGAKQLRKAFAKGIVRTVYLAENADPAITGPIEDQCIRDSIPFTWIETMQKLGSACGIEVGAAAAAAVEAL